MLAGGHWGTILPKKTEKSREPPQKPPWSGRLEYYVMLSCPHYVLWPKTPPSRPRGLAVKQAPMVRKEREVRPASEKQILYQAF
jgi:hypothetical protein